MSKSSPPRMPGEQGTHSPLAGLSILLVEDEPMIALDTSHALGRAGALVTTAHSLHQGLAMLDDREWSAAVLDYSLGDGDCVPLCDWLHKRRVPFVVCTGRDEVGYGCRFGAHLPKPVDTLDLVAVLGRLTQQRPTSHPSLR